MPAARVLVLFQAILVFSWCFSCCVLIRNFFEKGYRDGEADWLGGAHDYVSEKLLPEEGGGALERVASFVSYLYNCLMI